MTVAELIGRLKDMPQDAIVIADGVPANNVEKEVFYDFFGMFDDDDSDEVKIVPLITLVHINESFEKEETHENNTGTT